MAVLNLKNRKKLKSHLFSSKEFRTRFLKASSVNNNLIRKKNVLQVSVGPSQIDKIFLISKQVAMRTMCDFHNFGLIFVGQCTVCLKG